MTLDDLHLSDDELTQLSEALQTAGHPMAIEAVIAEQQQRVENYIAGYTVPALTYTRLTRALVLWELYSLVGQGSEVRRKAFEDTVQELKDINQGKTNLPKLNSTTDTQGGNWGSATKIS
jgi:hypothetical protein